MVNMDRNALAEILDGMPLEQRREWLIKILMSKHGKTFAGIAARHRLSTYGLAGAVGGTFPWYDRVVNALEKEFDIDLTPFLNEKELEKNKRNKW